MTHIIFALINGLHNNKLETGVVQLFELIKNRLLQIFKFPKIKKLLVPSLGVRHWEVRFTESEKHWFWLFQKHQKNGGFQEKPS
jgi:hypothetical protein